MKRNKAVLGFFIFLVVWLSPLAHAIDGELTAMGGYSRTNYSGRSYSTTKRYTGGLAVNLTSVTQIEASYTYTDTFFNYDPIQTTQTNEQILSLSLIQAIVPSSWVIQPYVKAGGAQYNRKQSGTIDGVPTTPSNTKSPSLVLGAGVRLYLLRNFSLKVELVSYLPDFKIRGLKDNFNAQGGISWHF